MSIRWMGIADWWRWTEEPGTASTATDGGAVHIGTSDVEGLTVHEYRHLLPHAPLPMRTFVSEGLSAWGAHEICATVPADWDSTAVEVAKAIVGVQRPRSTPPDLGSCVIYAPGPSSQPRGRC